MGILSTPSLVMLALCWIMALQMSFSVTTGAKILAVSFFSSQSHKNVYEPLLIELGKRGHSVTVVTPMKAKKSHKNVREINGMDEAALEKLLENSGIKFDFFDMRIKKEKFNIFGMNDIVELVCRSYYEMAEVKALKNQKFDLVFASSFMNECTYGLVHQMNTSLILVHPFSLLPWTAQITGTPSPPSFVPLALLGTSDRMNFQDRAINFLAQSAFYVFSRLVYYPKVEKIYKDYTGESTPGINEVLSNTSLILANSYLTLNYARPTMPDIIEVGGMHCREAEPLPEDLNNFLNNTEKDGFIYFSMGSVLKGKKMPEKFKKIFATAFSRLKQKVVWKYEEETMEDKPKNVKIGAWLPQQDILGHPNLRLFITHGGLLSMQESVYHGVPLLCIPLYGDQDANSEQAVKNGFASTLEFGELSEEKLVATITKMLHDPKYRQRVKSLSAEFRDRPQKPLDLALYWTEYVMRHHGAVHLRSPSRDLNVLQYHSVDVLAFVAIILVTILYILLAICSFFIRMVCSRKESKKATQEKKNK